MKVNINNSISISEANQNFLKVAKLVDESGAIVILKNNKPKYVLVEYSQFENEEYALNSEVKEVTNDLFSKYLKAFEKLAK